MPFLALFLWFVLLLAVLRYDPAKDPMASWALWVPVAWLIMISSRLPAQWLGTTAASATEVLEEGNWLDRGVYLVLMLLALHVLTKRSVRCDEILASNAALTLLILFALLSVVWSDFPGVSFRRWIRDLGTYLMVLVVLSDPRPLAAIDTVIRRVCYTLVSLSVVLVKYFQGIGVVYDQWTGAPSYIGASTSKNGLGVLCLVSGTFFFWDTVRRWSQRSNTSTKRTLLVNIVFGGMTLWLLKLSNSATSQLCLLIGCVVIMGAHSRFMSARPRLLKMSMPSLVCLYFVLDFFIDITDVVAAAFGRDRTMTGRADIWEAVLALTPNSLLGAGYESFWLGDRLTALWTKFWWHPTQAHNGYLEVYLNLGLFGICALGVFLLISYRRIWRPTNTLEFASLSLAVWVIMVLYNVTESAAFKGPLWVLLLLGSVIVRGRTIEGTRSGSGKSRRRNAHARRPRASAGAFASTNRARSTLPAS